MDVLLFKVKNHQSAVPVNTSDVDAVLLFGQLTQKLASDRTQVTGQDHIVIGRRRAGVFQEAADGITRGRGKCQGKTIKIFKAPNPLILLGFRHFNYGCGYGVVAMKGRL